MSRLLVTATFCLQMFLLLKNRKLWISYQFTHWCTYLLSSQSLLHSFKFTGSWHTIILSNYIYLTFDINNNKYISKPLGVLISSLFPLQILLPPPYLVTWPSGPNLDISLPVNIMSPIIQHNYISLWHFLLVFLCNSPSNPAPTIHWPHWVILINTINFSYSLIQSFIYLFNKYLVCIYSGRGVF